MQSKNNILKAIVEKISSWIRTDGYIYKTSLDAFVGKGEKFDKRIVINLNKWRNTDENWNVKFYIQIRFHAIEELLNKYRSYLLASDKKKTSTVSILLSNLYAKDECIEELYLANQVDLEKKSNEIQLKIKKFAFPFFEKFSDLESLQLNLESDNPIEWVAKDLSSRHEILLAIYLLKGDKLAFLNAVNRFREVMSNKANLYHLNVFEELIQKINTDYPSFFQK